MTAPRPHVGLPAEIFYLYYIHSDHRENFMEFLAGRQQQASRRSGSELNAGETDGRGGGSGTADEC